jgi:glucokinase
VKGDIAACVFNSLSVAFKTYVRIEQINLWPGEPPYKKLAVRINQVLKHNYKQKMLQHIILAMAKNLDASTIHITKDQWFKWRMLVW